MDKKIEALITKIDAMSKEIKEVKQKTLKLDQLDEILKNTTDNGEKIATLEKDIKLLKAENEKLSEALFAEKQVNSEARTSMEDRQRRNNIVVIGLEEKANESWDDTEKVVTAFLKETMKVEVDIERSHRLGKKRDDNSNRPIIVMLSSYKDKQKIFKNVKLLTGIGKGCYINEDYSFKTRSDRAELVKFAKKEFPGKKFKLVYNQMIIENARFGVGLVGVFKIKI